MSTAVDTGKPLPETKRLVVGGPAFTESVTAGWAKHNPLSNTTLNNAKQNWALVGITFIAGIMGRFLLCWNRTFVPDGANAQVRSRDGNEAGPQRKSRRAQKRANGLCSVVAALSICKQLQW